MAFSCLLKIALHDGAELAGQWVLPWHGGQSWQWCGESAWAAASPALSRALPPAPAGWPVSQPAPSSPFPLTVPVMCSGGVPSPQGVTLGLGGVCLGWVVCTGRCCGTSGSGYLYGVKRASLAEPQPPCPHAITLCKHDSPEPGGGRSPCGVPSSTLLIASLSCIKNIIQPSSALLTSALLPSEPTNMLDVRAILWLETYLQVGGGRSP